MKTEIDAFEFNNMLTKHTHFRVIVDETLRPMKLYVTFDRVAVMPYDYIYVCFMQSGCDMQLTIRHIKTIAYDFDGWVTRYYITALDYTHKNIEEITYTVECM